MKKTILTAVAVLAMAVAAMGAEAPAAAAPAGAGTPNDAAKFRAMNYVVVTPNGPEDGGDFGPKTPGTKTGGIQEALTYAMKTKLPGWGDVWAGRNVYVAKGIYNMTETLKIPWMGEHWYFEAGDSFLSYNLEKGDAVVIDSQMNCRLKFGYIVAGNLKDGAVVHFKPETPFPQAPKGVLTLAVIDFMAIVGGGSVVSIAEKKPGGIGMFFDSSSGAILWNKIYSPEINACAIGAYLHNPQGGGGILYNRLEVPFDHLGHVGLIIGDANEPAGAIRDNQFNMGLEAALGVQIFEQRNTFILDFLKGDAPQSIIFEAGARDNVIYTTQLPGNIVNRATVPTNRVVTGNPVGFAADTPAVPGSGQAAMNRQPYPVEILIVEPGQVSAWEEIDANGKSVKFTGGLSVGQRLLCQPGDQVKFQYSKAPTWKWKAER